MVASLAGPRGGTPSRGVIVSERPLRSPLRSWGVPVDWVLPGQLGFARQLGWDPVDWGTCQLGRKPVDWVEPVDWVGGQLTGSSQSTGSGAS